MSVQPGPCVVCGRKDYPLSCGGPTICPSCDCGVDPELTKQRALVSELKSKNEALEESLERLSHKFNALEATENLYHNQRDMALRESETLKSQLDNAINAYDSCAVERDDLKEQLERAKKYAEGNYRWMNVGQRIGENFEAEWKNKVLEEPK
jgi:uncharacterized protein (DUF342 family)